LKRKVALVALGALALGGIAAAYASIPTASAVTIAPQVGSTPSAVDAAESGHAADIPGKNEGSETPDPGEKTGGPDTDNVQHEGNGNVGNHAVEPGK
jgi:hypothetical protein